MHKSILALGIVMDLAVTAHATPAPLPEPPAFRLPESVRPLHYDLDLELSPEADDFGGSVGIDVEIDEATPVIWLQAEELTIVQAQVIIDGKRVEATTLKRGRSWLGIRPPVPLPPGKVRLELRFRGLVREGVWQGIYRERFAGESYLYSQLQSIYARKVFPCFDEPRWKTPFRVTLRVPAALVATSNGSIERERTEGGARVLTFRETAPLPTYLVAVAVGPFDVVDGGRAGVNGTPLRFFVPRGRAGDAVFLVEATRRSLEWLERTIGVPFPYEKLDTAISATGGAMENAGLIISNAAWVMPPKSRVTDEVRKSTVGLMLHELAHQWCGDLVTPAWWDDIWLNESFATFFAAKGARELDPTWQTAADDVAESQMAQKADSSPTARRVRQPVVAEYDIQRAFDGVTYAKGGAVLRMLEGSLGSEVFLRGLKTHLTAHANGVATTADFLAALSRAAGRDVAPLVGSFVDQVGVPVVSGELSCEDGGARLRLTQERFRPVPQHEPAQTWRIPVCVRHGRGAEAAVSECFALDGPLTEVTLEDGCPDWLVLNAGHSGYYQSAYRPAQLAALTAAGGAISPLSEAEALGVIADISVRAGAGLIAVDEAIAQASALAAGRGDAAEAAVVWLYVTGSRWIATDKDDELDAFRAVVRARFAPRARELGLEHLAQDGPARRDLRQALIWLVGELGRDEALGAQAVPLARAWLADPDRIETSLVQPVLDLAVHAGGRAVFDELRGKLPAAGHREQRQILAALTASRDPELRRQAFAAATKPEMLATHALAIFAAPRGAARRQLLGYLEANLARIWKRLPAGAVEYPIFFGYSVCTPGERATFMRLFAPRAQKVPDGARTLAEAVAAADRCIAVRAVEEAAVGRLLSGDRGDLRGDGARTLN